ncbi:MAG TPA: 50S ribosomal protein L24 [Pseudomonadota bacterium]|jgi:large subunit ribosomal protein L24|nr:50S ribosomal protein L24 [Pseudomonadota bacterium]
MERIRKGDLVQVMAGKERGKRGRVLKIIRKSGSDADRVVVERLQMVSRHTKPSQKNQQGGILEKEGSIHLSNVMPIDPQTGRPTRVRVVVKAGVKQRVAQSGAVIEVQN